MAQGPVQASVPESQWYILLAALAYLASALAGLLALYAPNRSLGLPALIVPAWFGLCFAIIWGRRNKPFSHPFMRRGTDIAALIVVFLVALRIIQALQSKGWGGEDWRILVAGTLLALLMINALVIVTPADAERSLLSALILSLYSATRLEETSGILLLAGFMWLWLGAMVLAVMIEDSGRRVSTGSHVLGGATASRVLRSGLGFSLLAVTLGIGSFLAAQNAPVFSAAGAGGRESRDAWRYDRSMNFSAQTGLRPGKKTIYRIRGPRDVYRFRVQAFDTYRSGGWSLKGLQVRELGGRGEIEVIDSFGLGASMVLPGKPFEMMVSVEVGNVQAILSAERPLALTGEFPGPLLCDAVSGLRSKYPLPNKFQYRLRGWRLDWTSLELDDARWPIPEQLGSVYWALPGKMPERLCGLARDLAAGAASPWGKALLIAQSLKKSRGYQAEFLLPPGRTGADPVDYFVFEGTHGNCLNFASALVVMARLAGVPARLAVGYLGHRYEERRGEWILSPADGHAWCEIALEKFGWIPLDPVPPALIGGMPVGGPPDPHPGSSPLTQASEDLPFAPGPKVTVARAARALGAFVAGTWPWLLVTGVLFWAGRTLWRIRKGFRMTHSRRRKHPRNEVEKAYLKFCEAAVRRGYLKRETQTPLEYARQVGARQPALRSDLLALAELFTRAEYGETGLDDEMRREARQLSRKLQTALSS